MASQSFTPAQSVTELLEQLNLYFNKLEPVIICYICQFALSGSIKPLVDHVVDRHQDSKDSARELSRLLRLFTILGLKELRLRPDHFPHHLHLMTTR
jgi:hypothetical protein